LQLTLHEGRRAKHENTLKVDIKYIFLF